MQPIQYSAEMYNRCNWGFAILCEGCNHWFKMKSNIQKVIIMIETDCVFILCKL